MTAREPMGSDSHPPIPPAPTPDAAPPGRVPRDDRRRSERLAEGGIVAGLMLLSAVATAWMLGGARQIAVTDNPGPVEAYRLEFWRPTRVQQVLHPLQKEPATVRLYRVSGNCLLHESKVIDLERNGDEPFWAMPHAGTSDSIAVSVGDAVRWEGLRAEPRRDDPCPALPVQ